MIFDVRVFSGFVFFFCCASGVWYSHCFYDIHSNIYWTWTYQFRFQSSHAFRWRHASRCRPTENDTATFNASIFQFAQSLTFIVRKWKGWATHSNQHLYWFDSIIIFHDIYWSYQNWVDNGHKTQPLFKYSILFVKLEQFVFIFDYLDTSDRSDFGWCYIFHNHKSIHNYGDKKFQ